MSKNMESNLHEIVLLYQHLGVLYINNLKVKEDFHNLLTVFQMSLN